MITIALDPDIEASGMAIIKEGAIVSMFKVPFPELIEQIVNAHRNGEIVVKLEDVEANKPMFVRNLAGAKQAMKVAQNVGMCKGVARMIKESLEYHGVTVQMIKPLKGAVKKAKKDASYFNQITGWEKRSNEDCRDAALIGLYGNKKL